MTFVNYTNAQVISNNFGNSQCLKTSHSKKLDFCYFILLELQHQHNNDAIFIERYTNTFLLGKFYFALAHINVLEATKLNVS